MKLSTHFVSSLVIAVAVPAVLSGQSIVHNAGPGDLTFFYDSAGDSFDVVFRSKSGTEATGLTDEYAGPPGGVGGPGPGQADWNFSTLLVNLTAPPRVSVGGIDYFVSPASGSEYEDSSGEPDLGLRFRFREDDAGTVIDQFSSFNVTLDWEASMRPEGAEFVLFGFDELDQPDIRYQTTESQLAYDWSVWGHDHWHWGFSEPGSYSLVFDFRGELPGGGFSDTGTATVDFEVIPEPATVALLIGLGAFGVVSFRRLRGSRNG